MTFGGFQPVNYPTGGGGGGPWTQVGGTGGVIEPLDMTAGFEVAGGTATASQSVAIGPTAVMTTPGDIQLGDLAGDILNLSSGVFSFSSSSGGSFEFGDAQIILQDAAGGIISFSGGGVTITDTEAALAGAIASGRSNCFAVGLNSGSSVDNGFAMGFTATAEAPGDVSIGTSNQAAGGDSVSIGTGALTGLGALDSIAIGLNALTTNPGDIALGAVSGTQLGFFGVVPVSQQIGGPATAGAVYTAVEQGMLNAVYDALQAYGLLT